MGFAYLKLWMDAWPFDSKLNLPHNRQNIPSSTPSRQWAAKGPQIIATPVPNI